MAAPVPPRRTILFVCTGNTCRSPMAEAICRRMLADRLGCAPHELPLKGFEITSAGVAAYPGDGPAAHSVAAAEEFGADLHDHRSRAVHPDHLARATDVLAMTQAHAALLRLRYPGAGPEPQLLAGPGVDLPDPIGGDLAVYRECAAVIRDALARVIDRWLPSAAPAAG